MSREREPILGRVLLAPLRAWDRFFFAEMDPRPLALMRILTGALEFVTFIGVARTAAFFDGDAGWAPVERIPARRGWTPRHALSSPQVVHRCAAGVGGAAARRAL